MSDLIINRHMTTMGELSVSNRIVEDAAGKQLIVTEGILICEDYYEEIDMIESDGLTVKGVFVVEEIFTSESRNITYRFQAEELVRGE